MIDDFNTIGSRVPLLGNLKPHGKVSVGMLLLSFVRVSLSPPPPPSMMQYHMADLDRIGGVPVSYPTLTQPAM